MAVRSFSKDSRSVKRVIVPNSFPLKPEHQLKTKRKSEIFLRYIFNEFLSETNRLAETERQGTAIVNESFVLHRNRKDVFGFYRILRSRAMIAVLIKRCSFCYLSLETSCRFTSLVRHLDLR